MAMKKGGGLLAILGAPKGGSEGEGAMDAKVSAMADFDESQKAGDHEGMAAAFKRAYDACAMAHGDEGESYPEEE